MNKRRVLIIVGILVAIIGFVAVQTHRLNIAHSTFQNYSAFRGCRQLIEKTDTYGICKTSSGETIKIVLINGKWYLDGDGPGIW